MNWKEFFKLDMQHIIVFIILIILSSIFSSISQYNSGDIITLRANGLFLILSVVFGMFTGTTFTHRFIIAPYTITLILFSIIYTYIVSSVIVFTYHKFRKK